MTDKLKIILILITPSPFSKRKFSRRMNFLREILQLISYAQNRDYTITCTSPYITLDHKDHKNSCILVNNGNASTNTLIPALSLEHY